MIKKSVSFDCIADKYYSTMTESELSDIYKKLLSEYENIKAQGLSLDMSRGKPSPEQVSISDGILTVLKTGEDCKSSGGADMRNYGLLADCEDARRLFGELCGVPAEHVISGGNSSLTMMYDTVARAMLFGVCGEKPWKDQGNIKFLCPCPGYDRHFAICAAFGIEMINIKMTESGPDMDEVERLVSSDASIKGIWCVPKFSNPTGAVYSDETIARFSRLRPAAKDFRIFWDNAYIVHDFGKIREIPNIFDLTRGTENEDIAYMFVSTSKITYPGAGVAAMISSEKNIADTLSHMTVQSISYDKINQLRHAKYFGTAENLKNHMSLHAKVLKRKFDIVLSAFENNLSGLGIAEWTEPKGGYFISLDVLPGTARRVWQLCKGAGVTLTNVGATFPYGIDPEDTNLRIAPSYPSDADLSRAAEVLCLCVKLAAAEKLARGNI